MEPGKKEEPGAGEGEGEGQKTFEFSPVAETKDAPKMTLQEAEAAGWSPEEIDIGKNEKMFREEESGDDGKKKVEGEGESEGDEGKKEIDAGKKNESSAEDYLLDPGDEKALSEAVKDPNASKKLKNVAAQYFGRKQAISRAQAAEGERDRLLDEMKELKAQNAQILEKIGNPKDGEGEGEGGEDENTPMTKKDFREMLKRQKEDEENARNKEEEKTKAQAEKINKALKNQESHAKSIYTDFDDVVGVGNKLVQQDPKTGKFVSEVNISNIPEAAQKRAFALLRRIKTAAARADEMALDDYTVADMTYDLGKLAGEFIKPEQSKNSGKAERKDGSHNPEEEEEQERIRKNKSRTGSSASISGNGGRKVLSVSDVTLDDLNAMPSDVFDAFERQHPDKVSELMR